LTASLSLIVNTYENASALAKVLEALFDQTHKSFQTIVADDGSSESTAEVMRSQGCRISAEHCWQEHDGFRRSVILNKAIAQATGDYVVFLDGDSVPARNFISDHITLAERGCWVQGRRAFVNESCTQAFRPNCGHLWSLALRRKLSGLTKALRLPFPIIQRNRDQRGILGCNLGIWLDDLIAVNGYDESFTGWGREDADLGNRLYHLGRDRKFVYGRAIVYHLNHPVVPRDRLCTNQALLDQTIAEGRTRARCGLDKYLR